jgi:SAM-dependent methyltransferase
MTTPVRRKPELSKYDGECAPNTYGWAPQEKTILLEPYRALHGSVRGRRVLDIGCGTGWLTKDLFSNAKEVIAVDKSPAMIERAIAESARSNIKYRIIDAKRIGTLDGTFDIISSALTMQLITPYNDLVETLRACTKRLANDGRIIILIPHPCFVDRNERPYNKYTVPRAFNYFKQEQKYTVTIKNEDGTSTFTANFYNLQGYFDAFATARLCVERIVEPTVPMKARKTYRWTTELQMPNYLLFKLKKR